MSLVRFKLVAVCAGIALVGACGDATDNIVSDGDAGATQDGGSVVDFADADPNAPDARPNEGCQPESAQCNNCIDDDGDMLIDGFDPECTGALDDNEASFATGIPGDNVDAKQQDCFFDGNSGGGDDKCKIHTCCLLDGDCPAALQPPNYDPGECMSSQECIDNCEPLTPPGCDCFGCCTICNGTTCEDVLTNPAVAPDCTADVIDDPALCPRCTQVSDCGTPCNPLECNLCPGQTEDDLPPECDAATCPGELTPCIDNTDCNADQFCSSGCCIGAID